MEEKLNIKEIIDKIDNNKLENFIDELAKYIEFIKGNYNNFSKRRKRIICIA